MTALGSFHPLIHVSLIAVEDSNHDNFVMTLLKLLKLTDVIFAVDPRDEFRKTKIEMRKIYYFKPLLHVNI